MKAVAVFPGRREVAAIDQPEPRVCAEGEVRLRMLEVGVCGTDKEIVSFHLGTPPPGCDYLILGHESLSAVEETGPGVSRIRPGDLVVSAVRHPCAHASCDACRSGNQDFCKTGDYRERGIKELHGFMTGTVIDQERHLHVIPPELREVAVLVEPLTIAEKVFLQLAEIQGRLPWRHERPRAVVLGAGPVGLLGAMGLVQAGFETWVYSRARVPNPKAAIAVAIGAEYVSSEDQTFARFAARVGNIDLVYEAMGAPQLAFDALKWLGFNGVFVFTGVPRADASVSFDTAPVVLNLVVKNQIVMGTVNAGSGAFDAAIRDLGAFLERWPAAVRSLITGRYPIDRFHEAIFGPPGGIKNVIVLEQEQADFRPPLA
ncbi:MAG TPA: glucose 1-dehydrogenase [Bryobacteraceae bacterium]|nr:glucose 1-dehydrogenase [Bryobacteraceae bacterium]